MVGASMFSGYSYNERAMLSLGIIDAEYAKPGTQVTLVWGEKPNTKKTTTEPHRQIEIRAIVARCRTTARCGTAITPPAGGRRGNFKFEVRSSKFEVEVGRAGSRRRTRPLPFQAGAGGS